jgi:hypothetical protein
VEQNKKQTIMPCCGWTIHLSCHYESFLNNGIENPPCPNCNQDYFKYIKSVLPLEWKEKECFICTNAFEEEIITELVCCGKQIHEECFRKWFGSGRDKTCPNCRTSQEDILNLLKCKYEQTKEDLPQNFN